MQAAKTAEPPSSIVTSHSSDDGVPQAEGFHRSRQAGRLVPIHDTFGFPAFTAQKRSASAGVARS